MYSSNDALHQKLIANETCFFPGTYQPQSFVYPNETLASSSSHSNASQDIKKMRQISWML